MSAHSGGMNVKSSIMPEMLQFADPDIFSRLEIGVMCLDKSDKVLCYNKVFQALTGTMAEEVIGKYLQNLTSTMLQEYSGLFDYLLLMKQTGNPNEQGSVKIVAHDGCLKYLSCEFIPYTEDGGYYNGTLFLLKDETIKTICSNKCLFADVELDTSHLPFVSFLRKKDDMWSVEYVSENVVQFGYNPEDFISGKFSYADIIHPEHLESVRNAVDLCTGDHFSKEYMLLTSKGESRWVLERSYAVHDEYTKITHFHGAILDIDDRKKYEKELESVNHQERSLSKLCKKAISCNDVHAIMNYTVKLVANTLDMQYCTIMEQLPDERFLLRYGYGISDMCIGSVVVDKNEGSQAGYTIFSGRPLIITDLGNENRFKVPNFLHEHGIVSGISVIIGCKERAFGTLCVQTNKKRKFTEHEINFLQSVSAILAETIGLRETFNSLELYRTLMTQSNDYILVLDMVSKKFIYASEKIIQDLGYSESEIMDQSILEPDCFMKGLDMFGAIRKVAAEGFLLAEAEFMRKNGTSFPVDISFSFVKNDGNIYMVLIGRDITERKKAHQMLKESENKLSAIFDNASDLICLSEIDGTIIEVNRTMEKRLFYPKSELVGMSIADITAQDIRFKVPELLNEIKDREIITVEIDILTKKGDCIPMEFNAQLIEYNGKKHLLSIGRDINERRILEKAIREHADRLQYSNEIKDMFADVTSHDLISSVALIEGFAEYLSGIEDNEEKKSIIVHIRNSTDKLRKTIDAASVFTRLNSSADLELETLDLRFVFYNSIVRLGDKVLNNDIILNAPESCPAYVNPIVEEVFFNLISNALKYSPSGAEVIVNITEAGGKWKVSVSDSGPGISDEDKRQIFGRFRRAVSSKIEGKGLGLAISKMAIKCHGEELHVIDNETGKGSTFWFTVRMADGLENFE
ncbi:PAS domain S-box protein [Methanolobus psychrotolerans]|uniref:PAS domain S-box protein n=1 Tax=Methanolobus psychrotolerans TaxID=1874706 RepID=UPI000B917ED2|nr:PAS domain S-box protein [Methanolobus psychrotolerans]